MVLDTPTRVAVFIVPLCLFGLMGLIVLIRAVVKVKTAKTFQVVDGESRVVSIIMVPTKWQRVGAASGKVPAAFWRWKKSAWKIPTNALVKKNTC